MANTSSTNPPADRLAMHATGLVVHNRYTDGTDTQRHILIRQCISTFASQANILAQLFHTDQRVLVICRKRHSCKIAFDIGILEIRQGHAAGRASM